MGVKTKLTVLFLVLAVAPTAFLAFVMYDRATVALNQRVSERLQLLVSEHEARLNDVTEIYRARLQTLVTNPDLMAALPAASQGDTTARAKVADLVSQSRARVIGVSEVTVLDPAANVVGSSSGSPVGTPRRFDKSVMTLNEGGFGAEVSQQADTRTLAFSQQVKVGDQVVGTIVMSFPDTLLQRFSSDYTGLLSTGQPILVAPQENSQVVLSPLRFDANAALSRRIDGEVGGLVKAATTTNEQVTGVVTDWRGQEVLAVVRPIKSVGWAEVVTMDQDEVLQPAHVLRNLVLALFALLVVILVIATLGIANLITRPLRHVSEVARKVSRGKLSERAHVDSNDEIGQLADSVNAMATSLQASQNSFVMTASHELRTPITALAGYLSMLKAEDVAPPAADVG